MSKRQVSSTHASVTITIAAFALLAIALIAASPAHAVCTTLGTPGGGPGDDRMCGTSGPDTLNGLAGNDTLLGGGGNDRLDGGDGIDTLQGDAGNDVLIGGPAVGGGDNFFGGSGNDQLLARDGGLDNALECGSGTDLLDIDLLDAIVVFAFGSGRLGCEYITVGAVNEGPNVIISRHSVGVGEDGRAAVRLRCPASLAAPCAGKLRVGHSEKSEGAPKTYSIDQGKKDDVTARLSHHDRRRLRRHGETIAFVTSVEKGQFGDKTTVETLKLIAQA